MRSWQNLTRTLQIERVANSLILRVHDVLTNDTRFCLFHQKIGYHRKHLIHTTLTIVPAMLKSP